MSDLPFGSSSQWATLPPRRRREGGKLQHQSLSVSSLLPKELPISLRSGTSEVEAWSGSCRVGFARPRPNQDFVFLIAVCRRGNCVLQVLC
jgi:hypothetical protein